MKLYIVTGASRGLGEALVRRLLGPGSKVFAISRVKNEELLRDAGNAGFSLEWFEYDLARIEGLENLMSRMAEAGPFAAADTVCLINNAGMLQPMAPIERCEGSDMSRSIQVNLVAPMTLTSAFIRHTAGLRAEKCVLNISSGAGKKPYHGWSSYCTAKAGLDMFTRCAGLEQQEEKNGVRVLSVAPGVLDTEMQREIREAREEDFRQRERFVRLKREGLLVSPDAAAERLVRLLADPSYATGSVLDLRDLPE